MNFKEHSEYKILSWEEIILHVDIIVPKVQELLPDAIKPVDQNAIIPATLLAYRLGIKVDLNNGYTFDLTDKSLPDICLFRVDDGREYGKTKIYSDITYEEQKLIFPWKSK